VDVPVRGYGGDLGNLSCGGYGFGVGGEQGDDVIDGGLGASVEVHGVAACCDVLDAFDGAGECWRPSLAILLVFVRHLGRCCNGE
jgi:hypothetical protein